MSTIPNQNKVSNDLVVSMDYELTVEGEVIDASEINEPLEFLQGAGNIIPGLEKAIMGMSIGESKKVLVKAIDAYGEFDPDGFVEVPKADLPEDIPMEVGVEISVDNEDGEEMDAVIEEVSLDTVTLNFNHPLAGKDLNFQVKIIEIRPATAEEIEHGHIHFEDHDCCCGDGDCDCEGGDCQSQEGECNCEKNK
ncbi:MAG: peptidylprolyl isomerase [Chloroflexi bacterium]|nr:peptidylprolyl isomerase [Chloroflexota bacterium]